MKFSLYWFARLMEAEQRLGLDLLCMGEARYLHAHHI